MKLWVPVISLKSVELGSKSSPYNLLEPSRSKKGKTRIKPLVIPLIVILIIAGLIFKVITGLNSPAEGIVSQAPQDNSNLSDPTFTVPGNYSGKYISISYPANYKPAASKLSGNFLEVAYFYGTKDRSKQISVGVQRENLADDSGVAYRRQHPGLYKPQASSNGAITFASVDGHERSSYFQHNGLVASIALSSSNLTDLTSDSQTVVNSLRWN